MLPSRHMTNASRSTTITVRGRPTGLLPYRCVACRRPRPDRSPNTRRRSGSGWANRAASSPMTSRLPARRPGGGCSYRCRSTGSDSSALGVMSQGELHARALSLFLPRATLPASTFRFLVIDDPVQSMDQARVDGLAKVLDHVARDRQVIVLTHDDRLPESVRRLIIEARVIGVPCRGVGEERRCSRCDRRARAMPHSGRGRVCRGGAPPPAGAGRGPRGCRADGR